MRESRSSSTLRPDGRVAVVSDTIGRPSSVPPRPPRPGQLPHPATRVAGRQTRAAAGDILRPAATEHQPARPTGLPDGRRRSRNQPSSPSRSLVPANLVAALRGRQPPAPAGRGRRSRLRDLLHPGPRPHAAPFIATSQPLARQSSPPRYASSTGTSTTASPTLATASQPGEPRQPRDRPEPKNGPNSRQV